MAKAKAKRGTASVTMTTNKRTGTVTLTSRGKDAPDLRDVVPGLLPGLTYPARVRAIAPSRSSYHELADGLEEALELLEAATLIAVSHSHMNVAPDPPGTTSIDVPARIAALRKLLPVRATKRPH